MMANELVKTAGWISPARRTAFRILERVRTTDSHSDDLLHGPLMTGLTEQDKNLTMAIVMGVLRWQLSLEDGLLPLLARPEVELPGPVATALRMGAFQLLHMDRIPPHAILNESVELVRFADQPQAAGMVNAVLRKVAALPKGSGRKPLVESVPAMATRLGHPEWMVERWVKQYGRSAAESICGYDLQEPAVGSLFEEPLPGARIDDGSRLVAELAVAYAPAGATRIWDACAAPGGKTAVLAARLPDARLLATDMSPKRLGRMAGRLETEFPGRVKCLQADASALPESEGEFDLILCDAPCTGTGTLARNPEIKVRLDEADLARQSERQRAILAGALKRLAPGGRLVYSTCSLEPEECEQVIVAVGAKIVPVAEALGRVSVTGDSKAWVRGEFLRTLPGAGFAGDGFFAAILER